MADSVTSNREDFEVFYAREFGPVVALAFALCGSWSSAEDLAQDAFVSAQRRWSKIGEYDQPGAWVRRAVANRSVSLTRRRMAEGRALLRVARETEHAARAKRYWRGVAGSFPTTRGSSARRGSLRWQPRSCS